MGRGFQENEAGEWEPYDDDFVSPPGRRRTIGYLVQWRPIETAPKDVFIFLYCPEDGSRWLAKWQDRRWHGVDDMGLTRAGASAGDPDVVTGWFVSHWMPLPPPPRT